MENFTNPLDPRQQEPFNKNELDRFCSKYVLGRTLSSGNFNAVAVGHNKENYRKVVIKAIYKPYHSKLKEANFLKKLTNVAGIIQYYDHYYVKNTVNLLVMQHFGHMNLKMFIINSGPLSEKVSYTIFKQIASAAFQMFTVHNILHRKLRPSNILINTNTLQIKIINLNSACLFSDNETFTSQLSILNAPPEYFTIKKYTADGLYVWSLGLILYTMLFNKTPFKTAEEIMYTPVSVPKSIKHISLDVQVFLKWTLTKLKPDRITLKQIMYHPWFTKKYV